MARSRTSRTDSCLDTRTRIFEAAIQEFSVNGLAGARTDAIARAAGVNIALLFYYFNTKEELYAAVLEGVFTEWSETVGQPLKRPGSCRAKVLGYVEAFFDFVAKSAWRPRLVQQEFMRSMRLESPIIRQLLHRHVKPVHKGLGKILREGIAKKEFRNVDVENFIHSMGSMVTQYFSSSSAIAEISGGDPLSAAKIKARRAAVLDVVSSALLAHEGKGKAK